MLVVHIFRVSQVAVFSISSTTKVDNFNINLLRACNTNTVMTVGLLIMIKSLCTQSAHFVKKDSEGI